MKNIKFTFCILMLCFSLINCSDSSDDSPTQQTRTFNDIRQDFSNIEFTTGNNDISLLNSFNSYWYFRVVMPDVDFTDNKRPLIVTLHGYSGGNPNAHKTTDCYAEPGFESLDAIILSPNGGNLDWFNIYNQEQVLSLIELASEYLPVDTDKIVINGYSDGGNGSWFLGETRADTFSASIPMASAYSSHHQDGTPRTMPIPFYVIHGENDSLFPLEDIEDWVNETNSVGSDVTLEVAPGLTHPEPCEYVPYLHNAANWLVNEVWN